jgi:hypothetical protein
VWTEARPGRGAHAIAVAMPQSLREAALAAVQDSGLVLHTLRPWWTRALDEHLRGPSSRDDVESVAAHDTDGLVLLAARGQEWELASTFAPRPPAEQTEATIARRMFAAGLEAQGVTHLRMAEDGGIASPWPAVHATASAVLP